MSYYYTGLTLHQIYETFDHVRKLRRTEQTRIYGTWYLLSNSVMSEDHKIQFQNIYKINTENASMMSQLHKYYSHNIAVINHYLDNFILPKHTKQYSAKLVGNAWDLAVSAKSVGFSGTADTKYTLPLNINYKTIGSLGETNGKMLYTLLHKNSKNLQYFTLPENTTMNTKRILDFMCTQQHENKNHWHVLIDGGGLILNMSNKEVVQYVIQKMPKKFNSAVFFEDGKLVYIDKNSVVLPFYQEVKQDMFVYLDQSHTRGTDIIIKFPAHGYVTVGPNMTKDDLFQCCKRMRALLYYHSVSFWGTTEVTFKIDQLFLKNRMEEEDIPLVKNTKRKSLSQPAFPNESSVMDPNFTPEMLQHDGKITSKELIWWCIHNSIKSLESSMVPWATQGIIHNVTKVLVAKVNADSNSTMRKLIVWDEPGSLKEMYGAHIQPISMSEYVKQFGIATLQRKITNRGVPEEDAMKLQLNAITKHVHSHVPDNIEILVRTGVDDFCEREIEQEREEERKRELPPKPAPKTETAWKFDAIFENNFVERALEAHKPQIIPSKVKIVGSLPSLSLLWDEVLHQPKPSEFILNKHKNIFVTDNFKHTVLAHDGLDNYSRPIEFVLEFKSSSHFLVITGYEANNIFPLIYTKQPDSIVFHMLNYMGTNLSTPRQGVLPSARNPNYAQIQTILKLANGETEDYSIEEKSHMILLLSSIPFSLPQMITQKLIKPEILELGTPAIDVFAHPSANNIWQTILKFMLERNLIEQNGYIPQTTTMANVDFTLVPTEESEKHVYSTLFVVVQSLLAKITGARFFSKNPKPFLTKLVETRGTDFNMSWLQAVLEDSIDFLFLTR